MADFDHHMPEFSRMLVVEACQACDGSCIRRMAHCMLARASRLAIQVSERWSEDQPCRWRCGEGWSSEMSGSSTYVMGS